MSAKAPAVWVGDLAEYCGTVRALRGKRCEVGSMTASGKRMSVVLRLEDGRVVVRQIKRENLKRLGGGCLKTKGRGMRDEG